MNQKVRTAVQTAIDRCFQMNAFCDRMVYVMQGKWYMMHFAKVFHHKVAHAYPDIADKLSDVLLVEGENVTRGAVNPQMQDFANPYTMLEEYKAAVLETRRTIGDAYYAALDNAEAGAASMLEDILEDYQEHMVAQAFVLAGKAAQVQENPSLMDIEF